MSFETVTAPTGVVWRRSSLLRTAGVPHAFSTRLGGVSPAPFDSLNLGLADAPGEPDLWLRVQENWRLFLEAAGLSGRTLVRARQVHGCTVLQADRQPDAVRTEPPFMDGDGLISGHPGHVLAVRVADCAPVLLVDPEAGLVAAVHAGWRGVVGEIVPRAVADLAGRGARPERILAAVGACIGAQAFQVGMEVVEAFRAVDLGLAIGPDPEPGRARADVRGALEIQLRRAGLSAGHIDMDPGCTVADPTNLFSYRRDGSRSGRMACIIGL